MGDFFLNFWNIILSLKITDFIDIAIVAFLIYKLIDFFRENRSERLIKGILMIAVAYFFAYYLNLEVLSYLINILITNGILVLVIIFHPELRKALERFGRSKISNLSIFSVAVEEKRELTISAINAVVESFKSLQVLKMGALVVFENSRLNDIANTGTKIDAIPTAAAFSNIFFNKAPLHDGAVLVREGRIHSAGCILPLTANDEIDSNLGTRHRAAIGISENSDAVAAVLSEETGAMSVTIGGKITRFASAAEFSEFLIATLAPAVDADSNTNKFISRITKIFKKKSSKGEDDVK